ncbi:MAG: T9SS type A sorting domain-containing protein [Bacteroidetes bacterium]|nr:T9SS type A sorting domain-containing protein [Bacteroidota bacterium]
MASDGIVFIQNTMGQILKSYPVSELKHSGSNQYKLEHQLPAGVYLLAVSSNQELKSERIIVK